MQPSVVSCTPESFRNARAHKEIKKGPIPQVQGSAKSPRLARSTELHERVLPGAGGGEPVIQCQFREQRAEAKTGGKRLSQCGACVITTDTQSFSACHLELLVSQRCAFCVSQSLVTEAERPHTTVKAGSAFTSCRGSRQFRGIQCQKGNDEVTFLSYTDHYG